MCYNTKITKKKEEMERHFHARASGLDRFVPSSVFKAFDFPMTPVITNEEPGLIQLYQWGLIPHWADVSWNRTYTLNARVETLEQKSAFRGAVENRCLVIVNGFYEWQHVGRDKLRFEIGFGNSLFALAGLYDHCGDKSTYTVVTTEAKGIMWEIHNTKRRMPMAMRNSELMSAWLQGEMVEPEYDFSTIPPFHAQQSLF